VNNQGDADQNSDLSERSVATKELEEHLKHTNGMLTVTTVKWKVGELINKKLIRFIKYGEKRDFVTGGKLDQHICHYMYDEKDAMKVPTKLYGYWHDTITKTFITKLTQKRSTITSDMRKSFLGRKICLSV